MFEPAALPRPAVTAADRGDSTTGVLVFALAQNQPIDEAVDAATAGAARRWMAESEISGKRLELTTLPGKEPTSVVMAVGVGDVIKNAIDRQLAYQLGAAAVRTLCTKKRDAVTFDVATMIPAECHDAVVAGAVSGLETQDLYRHERSLRVPGGLRFVAMTADVVARGEAIGHSINHTRRLINEPAGTLYPETFADRARLIAAEVGLTCEIWDQAKLAAENCRAILAVGAGSSRPPRLVILKHNGGPAGQPPVAIVGKGVTFDSGGLSLKPSDGMKDMKCDMGGAATVVGVMHAVAKLGVKRNVVGVCGLAENMISGDAYKLGDVITTRSGKTIEILNTDAEGRVVLADTLDVTIGMKPSAMVDLATLTGACMVALGMETAGLMSNHADNEAAVRAAADAEGEPVWPLPMGEIFDEKIKSKVADIRNIGEGRWGGAITAAKFLENFVGDVPWTHIDIAGPSYAESAKAYCDAGATGVMVRTLIRWVESMTDEGV